MFLLARFLLVYLSRGLTGKRDNFVLVKRRKLVCGNLILFQ